MDNQEILCCPCEKHAALRPAPDGYLCSGQHCPHATDDNRFFRTDGKPVLIGFATCDTVCSKESYLNAKPYVARHMSPVKGLVQRLLWGRAKLSEANCQRFLDQVTQASEPPQVLIIGAGTQGEGTKALWDNRKITRTGMDIYASPTTDYVADAHYLPFRDQSFDGVWIQAVLEHVVNPQQVVAEIHRVLKPAGVVYAETPFMQQVHEGAYDYTRFTVLGHRQLFKNFEALGFGPTAGPGTVLAWSVRYLVWALTKKKAIGTAIGLPFVLLGRLFDACLSDAAKADGCSGSFFFGRKQARPALTAAEVPALYQGLQ